MDITNEKIDNGKEYGC